MFQVDCNLIGVFKAIPTFLIFSESPRAISRVSKFRFYNEIDILIIDVKYANCKRISRIAMKSCINLRFVEEPGIFVSGLFVRASIFVIDYFP